MKNPTIKQFDFVIKKLQLVREQSIAAGSFNKAVWDAVWSESDELDDFNALCVWVDENPKTWGGENGYKMFEKFNTDDKTYFDGVIAQMQLIRDNLFKTA